MKRCGEASYDLAEDGDFISNNTIYENKTGDSEFGRIDAASTEDVDRNIELELGRFDAAKYGDVDKKYLMVIKLETQKHLI